jgi:oligopeptide/dipeptide ABC transporter ATP-binding protein
VLETVRDLCRSHRVAALYVTHDLAAVAELADRVAVMYAGRIVESGPVRAIFRAPAHPYTRGLLASIPGGAPGQRLNAIEGSVPLLGELPPGCAFNPRCPDRFDPCTIDPPADYAVGPEQAAKCYLHDRTVRLPPGRSTLRSGSPEPSEGGAPRQSQAKAG